MSAYRRPSEISAYGRLSHKPLDIFFKYPIKKYVPLAYILSESIERISNFDENLLKFLKFQMYFPIQWRVV